MNEEPVYVCFCEEKWAVFCSVRYLTEKIAGEPFRVQPSEGVPQQRWDPYSDQVKIVGLDINTSHIEESWAVATLSQLRHPLAGKVTAARMLDAGMGERTSGGMYKYAMGIFHPCSLAGGHCRPGGEDNLCNYS